MKVIALPGEHGVIRHKQVDYQISRVGVWVLVATTGHTNGIA